MILRNLNDIRMKITGWCIHGYFSYWVPFINHRHDPRVSFSHYNYFLPLKTNSNGPEVINRLQGLIESLGLKPDLYWMKPIEYVAFSNPKRKGLRKLMFLILIWSLLLLPVIASKALVFAATIPPSLPCVSSISGREPPSG